MPSNPTRGGPDHIQLLPQTVLQKLLQAEKKLTALLSRGLLKDVVDSNTCQIAVFPVLSDSF